MARPEPEAPKVDFVVAGVQKAGTRALQHFLSQHPEIGIVSSPRIALHFFDFAEHFEGKPDYALYHGWYTPEQLARVTGDITPIYLYWEPAIPRIHAYNPWMKVVVVLRNPVDRAYSHWNMEFSRGKEPDRFWKALVKEPFRRGFGRQHRIHSYLHRGAYSGQVQRLLSYFPREQCLFVRHEDLRHDHHATLTAILAFLGVSTTPLPEPAVIHRRDYPPMPPSLRRALTFYFRRDIQRLERLLDWDLSAWLTPG